MKQREQTWLKQLDQHSCLYERLYVNLKFRFALGIRKWYFCQVRPSEPMGNDGGEKDLRS